MEITYQYGEGIYNREDRTFELDDERIQECSSLEEVEQLIESEIQKDFRRSIRPTYDERNLMDGAHQVWMDRETDDEEEEVEP